jgi:hypothetical protein
MQSSDFIKLSTQDRIQALQSCHFSKSNLAIISIEVAKELKNDDWHTSEEIEMVSELLLKLSQLLLTSL